MSGFPASPRVIYRNNPLKQVICQLRFPPLLRIESAVPADFQEAIRRTFPLLHESRTVDLPPGVPTELAEVVGKALSQQVSYNFVTEDGAWSVSLTRDFVALSAAKYERWEQFIERLRPPVEALVRLYDPAFFSRVGLRYQNVLAPAHLGLGDATWAERSMPELHWVSATRNGHPGGPCSSLRTAKMCHTECSAS